jgi:hypothetical protein
MNFLALFWIYIDFSENLVYNTYVCIKIKTMYKINI